MENKDLEKSSFRDPSGFLFYRDKILFRQINQSYEDNYELMMSSGLYNKLVESNMMISHKEVDVSPFNQEKNYKVIQPELIPFISYPYEWCFSQLKDAALLTLEIQKKALDFNMSLKDCSAYNIQFKHGKPIFIDTLSFEKYDEGKPWKAYRQFCQHFLAPLSLMSYKDFRLNQLLRIYIDGIPLDLTAKLLPLKTLLSFSLASHIHAHAKTQKRYEKKKVNLLKIKVSRKSLLGLIETLYSGIKKLNLGKVETEWGDYYSKTNYSEKSFQQKKEIISHMIDEIKPSIVWDLGANTGIFSRISSNKGINTISFDIDAIAVEKNYQQVLKNNETKILPLQIDLTNPSSDMGWHNNERKSLIKRGPSSLVLALALIHHLAISNNLPFYRIAEFFYDISNYLIIEFVPKTDSQVQRLLATREDIFDEYSKENFELNFKKYFKLLKSVKLENSERFLYLFQKIIDK
jgi:hypothetical protein